MTPQRILVLGSSGHGSAVTCYEWNALPSSLNLVDYDVVVLYLAPSAVRAPPTDMPTDAAFFRMFAAQGANVVVIGDLRSMVPADRPVSPSWLPFRVQFEFANADTVLGVEDSLARYFSHVKRTTWHLRNTLNQEVHRSYPSLVQGESIVGHRAVAHMEALAVNRAGQAIAFRAHVEITDPKATFPETCHVTWLPAPTEVEAREGIDIVLADMFGVGRGTEPPEWASGFTLPAQEPIEAAIAEAKRDVQRVESEIRSGQERLAAVARFRRLLYESGAALEAIVCDVFREFGAEVEGPLAGSKENGRFKDPDGRQGILGVKGLTKATPLTVIRQLRSWADDAAVDGYDGKGVLVVNPFRGLRPEEREAPVPDDCRKFAERFGQCLVTTTQLFAALQRLQREEFDPRSFWDAIMTTDGICPLPDLS